MKLLIAVSATALLLSSAAFAQTSTGTATSNSNSTSGAQVIQNSSVPSHQTIRSTGNAIAPALAAAGLNSCAGSSALAGGGVGFGFSFGTTHEMPDCNRRAYAVTLSAMGQNLAALDLICQNADVRSALNNTGIICPSQRVAAAYAAPATAYKAVYEGAVFEDKRGRKYRQVPRGTRGAIRSATGEYVLLIK